MGTLRLLHHSAQHGLSGVKEKMTDTPRDDMSADIQAEQVAGADDEYERAMKDAIALMEKGFHLGGIHKLDRDALHDRKAARDLDTH
ncbi:MAG: hypothetical protein WA802_13025 [Terracidiphilus sp.]